MKRNRRADFMLYILYDMDNRSYRTDVTQSFYRPGFCHRDGVTADGDGCRAGCRRYIFYKYHFPAIVAFYRRGCSPPDASDIRR